MDRHGGAVAAALLLLAPAAGGCSSGRWGELSNAELLGQGQFVQEVRPGAAREFQASTGRASASEAAAFADRAEDQVASGDPAGALATVRDALLRRPPEAEGERLRAIRAAAKKALLRECVVRAEVLPAFPRITEGDVLPLRLVLHNLSPVPLSVRAPRGGVSATLFRLSVTRTARDVYGNTRSDTWEERVPMGAAEVAPGGEMATRFAFATERFRTQFPRGFVEYSFGGAVLPSGMAAGEAEIHDRFPLQGARVLSFPLRWEEVAADPARGVDEGIRRGNPVRVLVAAACTAPDRRASEGRRLAALLGKEPPLPAALESGLRAALRVLGGDAAADEWSPDDWDRLAATLRPAAREEE